MSSETGKNQEILFNGDLAGLLRSMHPDWRKSGCIRAEKNQVIDGKPKLRPDILICLKDGIPVVIESEFVPSNKVETEAKERLGLQLKNSTGSIEQSIALKIPKQLKDTPQPKLKSEIKDSKFEFCVFSKKEKNSDEVLRWPEEGWITGSVYDLAEMIEMASQSENAINESLDLSENCLNDLSSDLWVKFEDRKFDVFKQIAKSLKLKESKQTIRIAMAIVLNAIMFHKLIVNTKNVKSFEQIWNPLSEKQYNKRELCEHWDYIIRNVNYIPIFKVALEILEPLDSKISKEVLKKLVETADKLEELGATSRRDFLGRLFQRLVSDRKYIATFHTLPSAAKLIAETAIDRMEVDWSKPEKIKSLKIADLACGTGSLLNASMQSIISKHNKAGGNGSKIHKHLVESVLVGADIMPAATHLTASILAGMHPENKFEHSSIFTLQYGDSSEKKIRPVSLGSLDLLDINPVYPAFETSAPKLKNTKGRKSKTNVAQVIQDNSCDLVIMNPPFTNPGNHPPSDKDLTVPPVPSFAGFATTEIEQKQMSERLKDYKMQFTAFGSGQAGLASNFFDIAHRKVKCPDGIIALILPFTAMRGASWKGVRMCLEENYTDILIFCIASTGQTEQAFSANTGMADILIIAKRTDKGCEQPIRFVNLLRQPNSMAESYWISKNVTEKSTAPLIELGDKIVANTFWGDYGFAGIRHRYPAEVAEGLSKGKLIFPRSEKHVSIPIVRLDSLGRIGLLYRDISGKERKKDGTYRGPFKKIMPPSSKFPTYPILWNHNAKAETRMIVKPDSEGRIHNKQKKHAEEVWKSTKSKLHTNRDFRLNSQPLAACITEMETIGGTAWPNVILNDRNWDKPVLLWMNSTLGLISFWFQGSRQQLGRARMTNLALPQLSVLDASKLSNAQLKKAERFYNSFKNEQFLPANEAYHDPIRQQLDQFLLVDLLGIDREEVDECLCLLRKQWCDEPSVHGGKNTAPEYDLT